MIQSLVLRLEKKEAEENAQEFIEAAEEKAKDYHDEANQRAEEFKEKLSDKHEEEILKLQEAVEARQRDVEDIKQSKEGDYRGLQSKYDKKRQHLRKKEGALASVKSQYDELRNLRESKKQELIKEFLGKAETSREDVIEAVKQQLKTEAENSANQLKTDAEALAEQNLERDAKRVLSLALNRFHRPYSSERGIGNVNFPNPDVMARTLGPERVHLKALEKEAGVDVTVTEEVGYASILGFDPVRRELGRASLEKLMHEKNLNEKRISDIVKKTKKDLFKKIRKDGIAISKELGLKELHEDTLNMMGALRYRYSFAQNQYFHCGEVGWLCGLLGSELGIELKTARRSGMLHDIGKAMDHSKDGGHAVIGADFIEKNGESSEIVHAVRAHHFDEPPSTELAYLTIAADAISGARPGARRSTMDTYHQKMQNLDKIVKSFDNVTDLFILNAGREVRVTVNSQKVDDQTALGLSKDIAKKIEEEMSYPGLIKVVVVRETHAMEVAR
ncbi:MAG: HDIG domain-containing metalloprotein [Pseudomonadota bacterium]